MKKDEENGLVYGNSYMADLSKNMLPTCICSGCPGKKKHKTTLSKQCAWHNKLSNLKNKDMPEALEHLLI
eukprot:54135-Ditylum_brightwellii.AAC.1